MTVSKQVWTPLPSLLHHSLSASPSCTSTWEMWFAPLRAAARAVCPHISRLGMAVLSRVVPVEKFSFWSQRMIEEPWQQFREFVCCASGKHWLMKWPRPWICWGRLFVADTLCIWALIVCSNQKVPDSTVIIYLCYIISARKARTRSILSIWNRVGHGGNDASIPNFPALPSTVNTI